VFTIFSATEDFFTFVPGSALQDSNTVQCPLHINKLAGPLTASQHAEEVTHRAISTADTWEYSRDFCYSYGLPLTKLSLYDKVHDCAYRPT